MTARARVPGTVSATNRSDPGSAPLVPLGTSLPPAIRQDVLSIPRIRKPVERFIAESLVRRVRGQRNPRVVSPADQVQRPSSPLALT